MRISLPLGQVGAELIAGLWDGDAYDAFRPNLGYLMAPFGPADDSLHSYCRL